MKLRLSAYTLCVGEHPEMDTVLLYNTLTQAVAVVQAALFRDIQCGDIKETDMSLCLELAGEGLLVDADMDEHALFKLWLNQTRFGFSTIETVPLVTTDCNMRCAYCFGNDSSSSYMKKDTCDLYIAELARTIETHGTRRLSIDYFGGEPLHNLEAIGWLAGGAMDLKQRFGLELRQQLTTNGYLLDSEAAAYLASMGITRVQVTVDGPQEVHDARRRLPNGEGTWAVIMGNIERASEVLRISVRINVDEHNYSRVPEFLDYLTTSNIRSRIQLLYVSPTQPTARPLLDWNQYVWDPDTKAHRLASLWHEMHVRGYPVEVFPEYMPCGAIYLSASVVGPSGQVFPCVGLAGCSLLSKGDVNGKPPSSQYVALMNLEPWERCKQCAFVPVCGGGCRWLALVTRQDHTAWLCEFPFFQKAYPQFLKYRFSRERLLKDLSAADRPPVHIL